MCALCKAQGTTAELFALPCLAASTEPERPPRQAHGMRTWFTPDGAISEMIFTDEEDHPRLTTELIDQVVASINPADIETEIMQAGAQYGYEHMVKHTLLAVQARLHDRVHGRASQAPENGG